MRKRFRLILATSALLFSMAPALPPRAHAAPALPRRQTSGYVRVRNGGFEVNGCAYRFVGTNFWYGMSLGSEGAGGDRARLKRELDRLLDLGVTNLRILASTEGPDGEPWRIVPASQPLPGVYDRNQLRGLDFLLDEMRARGMRAVVTLNNFWPWSGGMSQYLAWSGQGLIPYPPPQPGGSWGTYQDFTAKFYSDALAVQTANKFIRAIVTRVNEYSGTRYADDPAIMSWQLANEPRGLKNAAAFNSWIEDTSDLIRSLDANHLITTGVEGETPWPSYAGMDLVQNHRYRNIDYATAHVWAENWGWYEPADSPRTYANAVAKMKAYFQDHLAKTARLGKPLVVEEFGLARDAGSRDPQSKTTDRDRYYEKVFAAVHDAAKLGAPVSGVNFWAWAGEGLPRRPYGGHWQAGDPFTGDPPHESQGWYGVYAHDHATQRVISKYAQAMRQLGCNRAH